MQTAADLCARRRKFLAENAPEVLSALNAACRLPPVRPRQQCKTRYDCQAAAAAVLGASAELGALLESLADATEPEFLLVCHCVAAGGRYALFSRLLDHRLVDCQSLELLARGLVAERLPLVLDALRRTRLFGGPGGAPPATLSADQRDYLRRHATTARRLLRADALLDLLDLGAILPADEARLLRSQPASELPGLLVDFLTGRQATVDSLHRFCHALLLTGQYRLYSILHDIIEPERLELFFGEYAPYLHENDENCCLAAQQQNGYHINTNNNNKCQNNNALRHRTEQQQQQGQQQKWCQPAILGAAEPPGPLAAGFDEEDEEEGEEDEWVPPLPDGLLTDLCVDVADSATARQFYEANKHEVYKNFSAPKGLALIINNCNFQFHTRRQGTAVDVRNLTNLLGQLGYRVLPPLEDLSAAKIREQARRFAQSPDHDRMHSCVVVVLSHGEYDSITGVDGALLSTLDFFALFNARNAPRLAGKPRIFIMQACRGVLHDSGVERFADFDEPDARRWRAQMSPRPAYLPANNNNNNNENNNNTDLDNNHNNNNSTPKSAGILARIGLRLGWSSPRSSAGSLRSSAGSLERQAGTPPGPGTPTGPGTSPEVPTSAGQLGPAPFEVPGPQPQAEVPRSLRQFFPEPPRRQDSTVAAGRDPAPGSGPPRPRRVVHEPTDSDMLIAYATTPNYVSWRNSEHGTWFVQAICEVFSRHARHEDILTMLTRVNHLVASKFRSSSNGEKQIPECTNRLRRKFYFFPGWQEGDV